MTKAQLIEFEGKVASMFRAKKIKYPIHLSGGNEDTLINLFKTIREEDYVFSTHRNHYHYLLKGGDPQKLLDNLVSDNPMGSMHTIDTSIRFYSSAIVGGCLGIACGVAMGLQLRNSQSYVWVFIGDAGADSGWFEEVSRYAMGHDLPLYIVIEDNDRSVCTSLKQRWGSQRIAHLRPNVIYYYYEAKWPHVGVGEYIPF